MLKKIEEKGRRTSKRGSSREFNKSDKKKRGNRLISSGSRK